MRSRDHIALRRSGLVHTGLARQESLVATAWFLGSSRTVVVASGLAKVALGPSAELPPAGAVFARIRVGALILLVAYDVPRPPEKPGVPPVCPRIL